MDAAEAAIAPYAQRFERPATEVIADLQRYRDLLARWQRVQNLVSRETLDDFWARHIADSLQVLRSVDAGDRRFLDFGSGGGLPAIPLAIGRKGPTAMVFELVEPNERKAAFLRTVARELALPVEVFAIRAEQIDSRETSPPDVITSRALAPLSLLCRYAAPLFGRSTRALFHKGREYGEELVESRAQWDYDVVVHKSDTSADGVLLELRNLRAKTAP